ncbi:MAG: ABC transporter permease [Gammaproteobacteria bacterium]
MTSSTLFQRTLLPMRGNFSIGWFFTVALITLIIISPLLVVLQFNLHPHTDTWQHLVDTVLAEYITNSILLALGVATGTFIIGVPAACLCALYSFPGKRFLEFLLLLPLAIPAYIVAYTYTGVLDFSGPIQSYIRELFGWGYGDYWFPEIRSLGGAIAMFSFALYPYVFLLTRSTLISQSSSVIDAARSLGANNIERLFSIIIPLARPAIAAGVTLALMETLADYGTVQYFGVDTFTTGIFRTWFGFGEPVTAAQLSSILMLTVFVLFLLEQRQRRRIRYHNPSNATQTGREIPLHGMTAFFAFIACALPPLFGFIIPVIQLSDWAIRTASTMVDEQFWSLAFNSFSLAASAALVTLVVATILAYGKRASKNIILNNLVNLSAMGYAVPGTIIAVGTLIVFSSMDNWLIDFFEHQFSIEIGLIFTGTIFALVFAHTVRFLSLALQTVGASLSKINHSIDEASQLLGNNLFTTLRSIHLPLIRSGLFTAALLVFVEVMKELPATLIMRPFNFNTLAVRAYELASDERLADASTAALAIVITGIIPVILLNISIKANAQQ